MRVVDVDLVLNGAKSDLVGCTHDLATLNTTARHPHRESIGVVIPAERLGKDFFRLATKAGDFIDKFVTHKLRLAILGDVDAPETLSEKCVFLRDCNELTSRMAPVK